MAMVGNLHNRIMESSKQPEPKVGDGATILMYSDRHAGTVILVGMNTIIVQEDHARRTDSNGMSDAQSYEYSRNPNGRVWTFTRRKNGAWVQKGGPMRGGTRCAIGYRDKHHDFSF